jgi:DDB1- and CUL4-associated factor 7
LLGADGSVRMFDLRHMEYSTIVFEEPNRKPLLRLAWNKQDHNYLATFAQNSTEARIFDNIIISTREQSMQHR